MSNETKQLAPIDALRSSVIALAPQFKAALPKHVSDEKFTRVVLTAISTTPALLTAERNSLFGACLKLAAMGLMPDGKESAIVTFSGKNGVQAQAMPMVSGILKLVRNSGELSSISPHLVYENDEFDYYIDEKGEHIKHKPNFKNPGVIALVYAVAITKDGSAYIEVMTLAEVNLIRGRSRSGQSGPWSTDFGEMAKKTVIRRLAKRLPMSTDLDEAMMAEDDLIEPIPQAPTAAPTPASQEPTPEAPKPQASRLAGAMASKTTPPKPAPVVVPAKPAEQAKDPFAEGNAASRAEYEAQANPVNEDEIPI